MLCRWYATLTNYDYDATNKECCVLLLTEEDNCLSSPCLNGATCISDLTGYRCLCELGFTGTDCETGLCRFCCIVFIYLLEIHGAVHNQLAY